MATFKPAVDVSSASAHDVRQLQRGQWVCANGAKGRFVGTTPAGTIIVAWHRPGADTLAKLRDLRRFLARAWHNEQCRQAERKAAERDQLRGAVDEAIEVADLAMIEHQRRQMVAQRKDRSAADDFRARLNSIITQFPRHVAYFGSWFW